MGATEPNILLAALIEEAGVSRAGLAAHINRVAAPADCACGTNTPRWPAG